jgi:hypothetical protein
VRKLIISARRDPRKEPQDGSKNELKTFTRRNLKSYLKITGDAQVFINPYEKASGDISRTTLFFLP